MTETSPITAPDDWERKCRAHARLAEQLLPINKAALFAALADAGIEIVTVSFDGYGDSGQIEAIDAKAGERTRELPTAPVEIAEADWNRSAVERRTGSVQDAIEALVYQFLRDAHAGWENDDGAHGDFTFDVAARSVTLDYNQRVTGSEYSHHVF